MENDTKITQLLCIWQKDITFVPKYHCPNKGRTQNIYADMKRIYLILLTAVLSIAGFAQNSTKEERHTYLWDVTLSMYGERKGYSNYDIYDDVVSKMLTNINAIQNEQTEIVVVPFQNKHLDVWRVKATDEGKREIISRIKRYKNDDVTGTNITEPLQYAIEHIFTEDRIDILKLLTDGKPNMEEDALYRLLERWCDMAEKKDVYGYYVMLTPDATSKRLKDLLEQQCRFEVVVSLDFDKIFQVNGTRELAINIKDDYGKTKTLPFRIYGNSQQLPAGYRIHFETDDNPYVRISETGEIDADGNVTLHPLFLADQQTLHRQLPEVSLISMTMSNADNLPKECEYVRLVDHECGIYLINKPEKSIEISAEDMQPKKNTVYMGKTKEYNDFWFVRYTPDTLTATLNYGFNEDAIELLQQPVRLGLFYRENNGGIERLLRLAPQTAQVFVNDVPAKDNVIELRKDGMRNGEQRDAEIKMVFGKGAANRTYNLHLRPVPDAGDIDRINGIETANYDENTKVMTLRAKKTHVLNPLAVALIWTGIVLLALLLLWLTVLKTMFFPVFRISHVNLTGPEPYMSMLYVRGARQVVLTDKAMKQNALNKLFTGKIVYETNPVWTTDITITPVDKTSVRLTPAKKSNYLMDASRMRSNQDYTIENLATGKKTTIRVY